MPKYLTVYLRHNTLHPKDNTDIIHLALGNSETVELALTEIGYDMTSLTFTSVRCLPFVTDQFVRERFLELLQDTIRERNNPKSN